MEKDMVKLGYASDLKRRLDSINSSTVVPKAFRLYASYEVERNAVDRILHHLIDMLNPECRVKDLYDGKKRVREFFYLSKEQAYLLLESIAVISNTEDKLVRYDESGRPVKKKRDMYERLIGYINHVTVEEYSLFGECGISILKFVNPVFLKTNDGDTKDGAGDDGNGMVAEKKNTKFRVTVSDCSSDLFSLVFGNRKVLESHEDYDFLKLLVPLSYDYGNFECGMLSEEWFIHGFKDSLDKPLSCDCCSATTTRLFGLKNKVTGHEVFLCNNCLRTSPNGHYSSYLNLFSVFDSYVLEAFLDLRDKAVRNGRLAYGDVFEPFAFAMLIGFGLLPKSMVHTCFSWPKETVSPMKKDIDEDGRIWLQKFCDERLMPFLLDDGFRDYRFDSNLSEGYFFDYLDFK